MPKTPKYYDPIRGGRAPTYLHEAFHNWVKLNYAPGDATETDFVVIERGALDGSDAKFPLAWICGQLWNCTDVLPRATRELLNDDLITFGQAARFVLMKKNRY